jgi:hypothetical protein
MNYKIIISALLTCLAIAAPLCLISLQSETYTLAWDKLLYHTFLLLGVAIIYWSSASCITWNCKSAMRSRPWNNFQFRCIQ